MKKNTSKRLLLLVITLLAATNLSLMAQASQESKSTEDLSFLIGQWNVVRVYSPNSENERTLKGTLVCKESLDEKFINCRYEVERPGKIRGLDEVFFNYNSIYGKYESLWLSSTWPIKVLMSGNLTREGNNIILSTEANFKIENGVTEFVRDTLVLDGKGNSFVRKTNIRTSETEDWYHHMTENARRID